MIFLIKYIWNGRKKTTLRLWRMLWWWDNLIDAFVDVLVASPVAITDTNNAASDVVYNRKQNGRTTIDNSGCSNSSGSSDMQDSSSVLHQSTTEQGNSFQDLNGNEQSEGSSYNTTIRRYSCNIQVSANIHQQVFSSVCSWFCPQTKQTLEFWLLTSVWLF